VDARRCSANHSVPACAAWFALCPLLQG
jgi:hypothetical protein